ncbi:MAG: hypothetical protein DCF17_16430 [Shackletoniella antarctica]|uniref:Prepilin-type cleavage/methylation domain-containing protein n=1 Tax=Shackletoniella antarctica TaxID=268115 RepID=A0A2W4W4R5_9CYAN|nr:MAG: hypothetical protein DCF17_16430 [Shackletoniella antarctica]
MAAQFPSTALTRWLLQKNWLLQKARANQRGFTLTELLVAIVVGSIILTSLLYLVVELLGTNLREERLTQAQQDTRRALDYISRDVREAVYVYANPQTVVGQLSEPDVPDDSTAVLAFWRLKPIDVAAIPAACITDECETLRVRHSVYDLVVYFHKPNAPGGIWSGPGRIIRYELTNYSNLAAQTPTPGYRDPSRIKDGFALWTPDGVTRGRNNVLADFIDTHNVDQTVSTACLPADGFIASLVVDSNNFFVCVRDPGTGVNPLNQSLSVFLRGSTANPGPGTTIIFGPTSEGSSLPIISTEVLVRGRIETQL